jgi:hypothetical protein
METDVHELGACRQTKYTQVKVSVDPQIANAFKSACNAAGVSMAAELSRFMAGYSNSLMKRKAAPDYATRRRRRTAVRAVVEQLERIKASEEKCRDNMPENFQSSDAYESYDDAISAIENAIDELRGF